MKLKTIISSTLIAAMAFGVSSCEDMLKVDAKTVLYDDQNTLDHATDTVYSVMGIISQMQKIADRTVILNEVRGDLVEITDHATDDLREIYDYDLANLKEGNKYDRPVDYYSIINNCNFFLANADTAYIRNHKNVFLKEYITVLSFRAWTYLQMAQVYGRVYFVDKPVLSGDKADANNYELLDIKQLATRLLLDFEDRFLDYDIPDYGNLAGGTLGDGSTSLSHKSTDLFIPVRIIMGDLYLWAEQYDKAAKYYQDYLAGDDRVVPTTTKSILWYGPDFVYTGSDTYATPFTSNGTGTGRITYIPMEGDEYNGVVSELNDIFSSTEDNDYWFQLTRSQALTALSTSQNYCYHEINLSTGYEQPIYMADKMGQEEVLLRGDLRLQSIFSSRTVDTEDLGANISSVEQSIDKFMNEMITIYRNDLIYLRLAEAMNRMGLPKSAFAILKYGLCDETISEYLTDEKEKAAALGYACLYDYDEIAFRKVRLTASNFNSTFDGLSYSSVYTQYQTPDTYNTMGIHSRGCGDAAIDTLYVIPELPTLTDSIRFVEEKIIDEMALETCFEGYRFGDLMRISMHRAQDTEYPGSGGYADNDFLASRVAARASSTGDKDAVLYDALLGDGESFNAKWFLKLIK